MIQFFVVANYIPNELMIVHRSKLQKPFSCIKLSISFQKSHLTRFRLFSSTGNLFNPIHRINKHCLENSVDVKREYFIIHLSIYEKEKVSHGKRNRITSEILMVNVLLIIYRLYSNNLQLHSVNEYLLSLPDFD